MTTTLTLGPNAWPLSIKASMTAEGVTLLVQSNDWREAVTISQTRAETLAVLREAIAAVEALQCGYGWGCTDLTCPEHGSALRANVTVVSDRWAGPEDAAEPRPRVDIVQNRPIRMGSCEWQKGEGWFAEAVEDGRVLIAGDWFPVEWFDWPPEPEDAA